MHHTKRMPSLPRKPRFSLLDPHALLSVADAATHGADKYSEYGWIDSGLPWSTHLDSLMRHALLFLNGEDTDPESGLHHMAHVAWRAIALLSYAERGLGEDDRIGKRALTATQTLTKRT